jgi:hypothetical protein
MASCLDKGRTYVHVSHISIAAFFALLFSSLQGNEQYSLCLRCVLPHIHSSFLLSFLPFFLKFQLTERQHSRRVILEKCGTGEAEVPKRNPKMAVVRMGA